MQRREFISLIGGAAVAWPLAARAQQSDADGWGVLQEGSPDDDVNRMLRFHILREIGDAEGQNVLIQ
jgi:putative ABC transport system substrate-binding protein